MDSIWQPPPRPRWSDRETLATIRVGGDLVVTVMRQRATTADTRLVVSAHDSDGNFLRRLAAFAGDSKKLLTAALPTLLEVARESMGPSEAHDLDHVVWAIRDDSEPHRFVWVGNERLDDELGDADYGCG